MSDFAAFSEDIENGMQYLEHHQILGAKWGKLNGPPYPLGRGDHSAAEKSAAQKAGIKVGQDSGKGSIENVSKPRSKSTKKKELTDEEKREAALNAVRSGDKKKITKYMDYLSTDELKEAEERVRAKTNISKEDSQKASKSEMDKLEAIRSGDKEKVRQFADKMSYQELSEAMNKIDLTQRLNYNPPPPSAMDKLTAVANKVDQFRQVAEKGISMYNVAASVYNSTHKDGTQWPIINNKGNDKGGDKSKEGQIANQLINQAKNDVAKGIAETQRQNQEKSYKEKSDEALRNAKIDYTNQQKFEKWKEKQEGKGKKTEESTETPKKEETKANSVKDHEYIKKIGTGDDAKYIYKEDKVKTSTQKTETAPREDKVKTSTQKTETAPREESAETKRLLREADAMDRRIMSSWDTVKDTKMKDYSNMSYDEIVPESSKKIMRETQFNRAMADYDYQNTYDYAMRHSEV